MSRRIKRWKALCNVLLGGAVLASNMGCSRAFWRKQADVDTYDAITEHLTDTRWALPRIDITPDARSRFYDPYDPDCAPLPPDDPAAHAYMHWVNGWEGYKCWHQFGDLMSVENPQWLAQFGHTVEMIDTETGEYIAPVPKIDELKLEQAVELAQIHNRPYQFQLENLFLAALNVTFERYQLGVRYLEPTGGVSETLTEGGGFGSFNVNNIGLRQMLPWGTQLVAELANTTLWSFGPGGRSSSISTLSFQVVQPLLNGAGRKVNLEALTQSERNLLYQSRDLARFRRELFTDIVSDYLSLLQQVQAIRNEAGNIDRTQKQVETLLSATDTSTKSIRVEVGDLGPDFEIPAELEGSLDYRLNRLFWTGTMTAEEEEILRNLLPGEEFQLKIDDLVSRLPTSSASLDVLQLQSRLTNSLNRFRGLERGLQDGLDAYKIFLGLPPNMEMTIDETLLKPFEVIDPRLTAQDEIVTESVEKIFRDIELGVAEDQLGVIDDANAPDPMAQDSGGNTLEEVQAAAQELSDLVADSVQNVFNVVRADLNRLESVMDERLATAATAEDRDQLQADYRKTFSDFRRTESDFQKVQQGILEIQATLDGEPSEDQLELIPGQLNSLRQELLYAIQGATVPQVSARVEFIQVAPFDLSIQQATQLALENRLDLMNAKAEVMDARRRVEVIANNLKAVLDVGIDGSISTDPGGTDPFDFRDDTGQLTASLGFDTPLDQIDERNAYRAALINYQRARRDYMLFEDQVKQQVRRAWRQLDVLKDNLETSRRAVRIAALQGDSTISESREPPDPRNVNNQSSGRQGLNLANALDEILGAQNALISNWVNYEQNRLNIYRDMGIMDVGPDGIWNDEIYRNLENTLREYNNDPEIQQDSEVRQGDSMDTTRIDPDRSGGHRLSSQHN